MNALSGHTPRLRNIEELKSQELEPQGCPILAAGRKRSSSCSKGKSETTIRFMPGGRKHLNAGHPNHRTSEDVHCIPQSDAYSAINPISHALNDSSLSDSPVTKELFFF